MKLVKEIFREYDIRGVYGEEMDEETAMIIDYLVQYLLNI